MAEWLYEVGIGETRAALVDHGTIVQARIEPHDAGLRVGTIATARLIEITAKGREGLVRLDPGPDHGLDRGPDHGPDHGGEALVSPLPPGITQGARLTVRVTREAIPEAGRAKLARCTPSDDPVTAGADLLARITATGHPVRLCGAHEADHLEAAGWSEILDEATTGEIRFSGGALRMSPTPAMTLFDVDGGGALEPLAVAAAIAVARAIVRHDIGGSIGIDFPTLTGKAPRQAVAAALDAALNAMGPLPFERTAVNGFGFLQIVRPRLHASLPERLRTDPAATAARELLRQIERWPPPHPQLHNVGPRLHAALTARPDWLAELARRTGVAARFEVRA